jgi:asparagine synthase (glutamine-hydrolysing)
MCGVAGIVDLRASNRIVARDALVRMIAMLHHRGPDELGLYRAAGVGLAHSRLSIIDVATGQQPLANEDQRLWIVFNGEIFNHVELREELAALGHRFRTHSDTEIILHAYESWGDAAFERMNGQWAIALWDEEQRRLVLCRDRFGVRPLYLCVHEGWLLFASEVKAIFAAWPEVVRRLDPVGIDQTLTFWSVVPPQSVFVGVEELRPGTLRSYQDGVMQERAYWRPRYPEPEAMPAFAGSLDDAVREVRAALERATSLRMLRSDVPVGSYLSGGLDSSLVAALGGRFARGAFQTFSLRFEDAEYDETPFQRLMVERLGSEHHEVVVSRDDIARVFPDVIAHTERPVLRTGPAPLYLLSRLVRSHGIKVVLTGEGADEVFAGYDLFREGKIRRFWGRAPQSRLRPRLLERLYPYLARTPVAQRAMARQFFGHDLADHRKPGFAHQTRWRSGGALKRLLGAELRQACAGRDVVAELLAGLPEDLPRWSPLAQDQYLEIRTLLAGYLLSSQGDRMLMAHSVEGRFPFLDKDVAALADALPAEYKLRVLDEKHVLKRAAHGWVADAILRRPKQPYRAPDAQAFAGPGRPAYVDEMLREAAVAEAGVFDPTLVAQLWHKCRTRYAEGQFSNTDNMALVAVLSTQLLHHSLIQQPPSGEPPVAFQTDIDRCQVRRRQ